MSTELNLWQSTAMLGIAASDQIVAQTVLPRLIWENHEEAFIYQYECVDTLIEVVLDWVKIVLMSF